MSRKSNRPSGRLERARRWMAAAVAASMILGAPGPLGARSGTAEAPELAEGAEGEGVELRRSREPSREERARMMRWHVRWRRQAAPLGRLLGGLADPTDAIPVGDPEWCRSLASSLLAFDRESAFPVPSYAADVHLRRAVQRLVLGATACLEGRLYEAVHRIREAGESFANAELVLRPYGVAP